MRHPLTIVPSTATYDWEETPSSQSSWGGKELDCASGVPTFLGAAQQTGFSLTCLRALTELDVLNPWGLQRRKVVVWINVWPLATAPHPSSAQSKWAKNSCFSLRRERVGLHIQHSSFPGCYPRKWLLFLLSWSADWTQHILDPRKLQRTMAAVWTSVWALTQFHPSASSEWAG